jgi:hypothetical protein
MLATIFRRLSFPALAIITVLLCLWSGYAHSEDLPITRNSSIPDFQNNEKDTTPYDFDAPPRGMFRSITMAEGFDEEPGFRRTQEIVPVKPTEQFRPDAAGVFIVFQLHQHYQAFKIFGRCFPEAVAGLDPHTIVGEDAVYIALEDESGFLKLTPPEGGWRPGRYKVKIHAGEQVNEVSLVGTMRFTIVASGK